MPRRGRDTVGIRSEPVWVPKNCDRSNSLALPFRLLAHRIDGAGLAKQRSGVSSEAGTAGTRCPLQTSNEAFALDAIRLRNYNTPAIKAGAMISATSQSVRFLWILRAAHCFRTRLPIGCGTVQWIIAPGICKGQPKHPVQTFHLLFVAKLGETNCHCDVTVPIKRSHQGWLNPKLLFVSWRYHE